MTNKLWSNQQRKTGETQHIWHKKRNCESFSVRAKVRGCSGGRSNEKKTNWDTDVVGILSKQTFKALLREFVEQGWENHGSHVAHQTIQPVINHIENP